MIELCGLSKTFNPNGDGERAALKSINLTIQRGQWLSLLGPNGSGKSTLLKLLAGEIHPSEGDIKVEGCSILREKPSDRARRFFFIEQDTKANLVPSMTIEENLVLAAFPSRFPGLRLARRKDRLGRIHSALGRLGMGLENRLRTQVRMLSGGERQAVVIAKALIAAVPILLLDEFLGAMDPRVGPMLLKVVRELAVNEHLTVISVTHNLDHVIEEHLPDDRIVMLREGIIVADTSMREAQTVQDLMRLYEVGTSGSWNIL